MIRTIWKKHAHVILLSGVSILLLGTVALGVYALRLDKRLNNCISQHNKLVDYLATYFESSLPPVSDGTIDEEDDTREDARSPTEQTLSTPPRASMEPDAQDFPRFVSFDDVIGVRTVADDTRDDEDNHSIESTASEDTITVEVVGADEEEEEDERD